MLNHQIDLFLSFDKLFFQAMIATRFITGVQVDASNNLTAERYLQRINEKFSRGDFDWSNDVPDINDVNTTLQLEDEKEEESEITKSEEVEIEIDEYPSRTKQQNGLTLYPDGVKEAYLKALQAAQMAKLDSFLSLQQRISKPFVFSYFENVPLKGSSRFEKNEYGPSKLKGKRAEMKHIFGKINPDDYYPGQKKNPIQRKKIKVADDHKSQYLATDRKSSLEIAQVKPFIKSKNSHDHSHRNRITRMVMGSYTGE